MQKDSSWGNYYVTTLTDYSPKNLENALVYSDNIYFAQAALDMGTENFQKGLDSVGFNETVPFTMEYKPQRMGKTERYKARQNWLTADMDKEKF